MLSESRIFTNHLLLEEYDFWFLFNHKSINDKLAKKYFEIIENVLEDQIQSTINWLETDYAKNYFYNIASEDSQIFQVLTDSWNKILTSHYDNIDELLNEIYHKGKEKGYNNISEQLMYTPADREAIRIAKDYNYYLIRKLSNDLRSNVKNKILEGIISGLNPRSLANELIDIGIKPLKGSSLSAHQRAVMIAKTETSRMQNTGMLQSYINEGYTEVKILTAEDDNVCTTCLEYAYNFNNDESRVFSQELLKRERVHNIIKLIKGGSFPPFHPNCRCTYLTVWKSKTEPQKNSYIIDLTPSKFAVFNSFTGNQSDIEWKMIKDKNEIYVDLPDDVKENMIDFESLSPIFTQMDGEAGISYNLTKKTKTKLKTNNNPTTVTLQVRTDDPKDILSVSHHHSDGGPPSFTDVKRCLDHTNNVKYANIHGPEDIFIMESRGKIIPKKKCRQLERDFWDCIVEANFTYKSKGKPFNDVAKEIIINNEKLNKYIKFYRCYK